MLDELTPRDVAILQADFAMNPWGERRDDLREASMTSLLIAAFNGAEIDANEMTSYLADPLSGLADGETVLSPDAMAAAMRGALSGREGACP